jgi:DNA polymerase-3 subunit delta'
MDRPLLHTQTKEHVEAYIAKPSHATILVGSQGAGKSYVAKYIARTLLGGDEKTLITSEKILFITPEKSAITIEQIRKINVSLKLKMPGKNSVNRVVIIEHAQTMTTEAQNALLKMLEEPPADTIFILTVTDLQAVLPTVLSRCSQIGINAVTLEEIEAHFASELPDSNTINKYFALSQGRIGIFVSLLREKDHDLMQHIDRAKEFLGQTKYDRLVSSNQLKSKDDIAGLLQALSLICRTAQNNTADSNDRVQLESWQKRRALIHDLASSLHKQTSTKLITLNLCLFL